MYVAAFVFTPDCSGVALILKNRPGWQRGYLNAIGGKIEEGESKPDAMTREFQEETGVTIWPSDWAYVTELLDGNHGSHVTFFACKSEKAFQAKTMTDEEVMVVQTSTINLGSRCIRWKLSPSGSLQMGAHPDSRLGTSEQHIVVEPTRLHPVYNLPWLVRMAIEALETKGRYFVAEQRKR